MNLERIRENPHIRFPLIGEELTGFKRIVYIPAVADYADELRSGGEVDSYRDSLRVSYEVLYVCPSYSAPFR